jgi:aminoglycoside phosphotransferase
MTKTTRIAPGIYSLSHNGQTFEVEQAGANDWLVFKLVDGRRQYHSDYATKRAAVADIIATA